MLKQVKGPRGPNPREPFDCVQVAHQERVEGSNSDTRAQLAHAARLSADAERLREAAASPQARSIALTLNAKAPR